MSQVVCIRGQFPTLPAALSDIQKEGVWPVSYLHGKGETKGPHHHPVDETLYLMRGVITFIVGGKRYELQPGDKLTLPAGTTHEVEVQAGTVYVMGWSEMVTWEQFDGSIVSSA